MLYSGLAITIDQAEMSASHGAGLRRIETIRSLKPLTNCNLIASPIRIWPLAMGRTAAWAHILHAS